MKLLISFHRKFVDSINSSIDKYADEIFPYILGLTSVLAFLVILAIFAKIAMWAL